MRRLALGFAVFLIAGALQAQEPSPGSKLLIAFASYRARPKYPDIFFYEHDGVSKGKILGSVPNPKEPNAAGHPSLSRDGRYCAFTFEVENKTSRIACWDLKERKFVELPTVLDSPNSQLGPALSGDGNLLAFAAWKRPGGTGPLWQVYLFDRQAKKLVGLPGLASQADDDRMPALSGDGRYLAFASNRKSGTGHTNLYLYDRKESRVERLPALETGQSAYDPSLSEDGNLLAFASERPGGKGGRDIYLFDRKANKLIDLPGLNTPAHEVSPSLSGDGRYIAFVSERIDGEGDRDIYLYDRQTQKLLPTPGLNSAAEDFEPCIVARPATTEGRSP
jgi:Tol biopolymer transport system component